MNVPPTAQEASPPSYAPNGDRDVRHRFPLLDKRGKPWGILDFGSGARSAKSIPLFYEDDIIHGSLEMDIEKGDSMRSVTVKVEGSVITGTMVDDRTRFLHLSTCLWTRKTSPPAVGHAIWPFSISLPREVTIPLSGQQSTFRMPQSFLERNARVTVLYEISVSLSRGMFRSDSKHDSDTFHAQSQTRPLPLRQRAYRLNRPLRGPTDDPEGWETSVTAMAHGYVFRTRQAVVQCTLSLARPLCYTRGSVIPCWITLTSGDAEALELYGAPDALTIHLRRCVRWKSADMPSMQQVQGNMSLTAVARAVWWMRSDDPRNDAYTRVLEGELRVPSDLACSSAMGSFSIAYAIALGPPDCVGFTPVDRDGDGSPLVSMPVGIATMYPANGPRPVAYAPPSYDNFTPHDVAGPSEGVIYTYGGGVNMGRT
ncbi:hypothetical protein MVEN_00655000 [Mycena venus]|uniref:Arrestin-like N-terminal domain-containing protein n=1 Tax=Mycena venus TaxID=2733690 RepID=A0A8H6YPZ9_9AGAR|nr:hypothetical protein MVEN_00655000 [Mycena venus]